ncbi:hypothetical protein NP493_391g02013 [Ridgeia piscesae]|uniref:Transgelin n=1 Tax=Ridgeia piscesae TaxID=27915 RepID=A0AAD9L2Y0_RIDPI|nr:hypothetical protein NP493_391g02013 [Ridgeia piscesae]
MWIRRHGRGMTKTLVRRPEILDWIEAVVGAQVPRDQPFEKVLKDGVILCNLMNKIVPGSVKRINKKGSNFVLMENHAAFQKAVKAYGVPEEDIFQTVDLFEARNVKQVVKSLMALARTCQAKGYTGPVMGPKMAEENKRNFSEEQIRQGRDAQISLQYGSNQGASQAGLNMGKQRMIID